MFIRRNKRNRPTALGAPQRKKQPVKRSRLFARRAAILGTGKLGLSGLLVGRLYQLQVVDAPKYTLQAEDNRFSWRLLAPTRGRITDRRGTVLADNGRNFSVQLVREQTRDMKASLKALSQILPIPQDRQDRIIATARRRPAFMPIEIADQLDWETVSRIELQALNLPGIEIAVTPSRQYPLGSRAVHVLGYVGAPTERDIASASDADIPLLRLPGFRLGKRGVEAIFDAPLRGTSGKKRIEINAAGRPVREVQRVAATRGHDLNLTLDLDLQAFAEQRLSREKSASAVVMDAVTGEVYALASFPAYDPNLFPNGIGHKDWRRLSDDPLRPLVSKALSGVYPPGSTFKMVTLLAALEAGVATEKTRVRCGGHMQLGGLKFHCWKKEGHGRMDWKQGLAQSCDLYFYELGLRVGITKLAKMANRLGIGVTPDIPLQGVKQGLMPTPEWKRRVHDQPWVRGETVNASIGQGAVLTSPLQLAVMTARLASGRAVQPRLALTPGRMPDFPELGLNPDHLDLARKGMVEVMQGGRGTARARQIRIPGFEMAGKTGTAQVARITAEMRAQGIKNEDRPWHLRHHALFVGYAPLNNPRYVASAVVEHGVSGGKAAAPVVRDLLAMAQLMDISGRSPVAASHDMLAAIGRERQS
ncbi:MAG: penicillin-binding protein 2 [Alphaproteobacteria bacterium]